MPGGSGVLETAPLLTSNDVISSGLSSPSISGARDVNQFVVGQDGHESRSFCQLQSYFHSMRRSFQILHSVRPNLSVVLFLASMMLVSLALSSTVSMFKEELSVRDRSIR